MAAAKCVFESITEHTTKEVLWTAAFPILSLSLNV
jgi:hypothetical protein